MLFSIILLIHFLAFAAYLLHLGMMWPNRGAGPRDYTGLITGITILVTGCILVAFKYPHVNYYKVVPKTAVFLLVTGINIRFQGKPYTKTAYYTLIGLTLMAACIAVFH
ncbi:hypothetical protein CLV59_107155 [Chitinophaga dinghuensis]|uniref:Uncharacterized protein n=1 Tax=Chitinophaga dinghuensis TaxID=1539050 RepID=A0A327VTW4_9BACT|nr:hypothetical protein [Chitinophaga dinghuensis]RAJ77388.1 hypothetical protein CLV59_107155 [Chitinophaga dinghuensis]